jgi:hypothetical protein
MRAVRGGIFVVLLVASTVIAIASPAFATPRLTTSTSGSFQEGGGRPDGGAVSPFFTPIGASATSEITITNAFGRNLGPSFRAITAGGTPVQFTCSRAQASAFVGPTHTRLRITRLGFVECKIDLGGVTATFTTEGVTTTAPLFLHVRREAIVPDWEGTLNIGAGQNLRIITTIGLACRLTLGPQSISVRRETITSFLFARSLFVFRSEAGSNPSGCPVPGAGAATLEAVVTYRHDTPATGGRFRITNLSPIDTHA